MSVYNYKKYKISQKSDSQKIQGVKVGDVVRRQYINSGNTIYSLMVVTEIGQDASGSNYFIGALLDGVAPSSQQLLEFVRITNLFDTNRSGAMYLTSSDNNAPYMDVIDGIAYNQSLCYPESISINTNTSDSTSQYVIDGSGFVTASYIKSDAGVNRICKLVKNSSSTSGSVGLVQKFSSYIANPNRVIISYKLKASRNLSATVSLGYVDDTKTDGSYQVNLTTDWQYGIGVITVDYSGRYLRNIKLNINDGNLAEGDTIYIAEFNAILLSSISVYNESSKTRIGKINGINDPVFGNLKGYGGYLQKLYASKSAHISGTLTAGDENGFGATFYAGKIHKNAFINSLACNFLNSSSIIKTDIPNPTGVGNVVSVSSQSSIKCQLNSWIKNHVGEQYTLSFWIYASSSGTITISQNSKIIGSIQVEETDVMVWKRVGITYYLLDETDVDLIFSLSHDITTLYFVAPQFESGEDITQYQPTDSVINTVADYGAWFSRGGIGGTIQNPLLRLNFDGNGAIGTRNNSLLLKQDGSGHLANGNILWNNNGDVTFGEKVKLDWNNISSDVQKEITLKEVRLIGTDVFVFNNYVYLPESISITAEILNMDNTATIAWYYYNNSNTYYLFENETSKTISILPEANYWNGDYLTIKCEVTFNGVVYNATTTIRKYFNTGYTISIASSEGVMFRNGHALTTLSADIYYHNALLDYSYAESNFNYSWTKYTKSGSNSVIDTTFSATSRTISVDIDFTGQVYYTCSIEAKSSGFPYAFPLIFSA